MLALTFVSAERARIIWGIESFGEHRRFMQIARLFSNLQEVTVM